MKPTDVVKSLGPLLKQVRGLVEASRRAAAASVSSVQVRSNFEIGRAIVEHEQRGRKRAAYGKEAIKALAVRLTAEFGRGYSARNLEYCRRFYLLWNSHLGRISQKPSAKSAAVTARRFALGWSHYVFLLGVRNSDERRFYEIEAEQGAWSLPELRRQFNAGLYERLALSRGKGRARKLAERGQTVSSPADLFKDPYVLEFLGLNEDPGYSETDLESAIIGRLQSFLLELGKGFLFEARQKRFTFGDEHFFVDLVFYNRLLRCYVLVDLKIGKLTHQDLGQMQMYVNYFDRFAKTADEHPTVGIVLCKEKNDALVEITLPRAANIFASEYRLYLPSKEDLRARLLEWTREDEARRAIGAVR